VEALQDLPPDAIAPLVADSERDGRRFVSRLHDEWRQGTNRFDRPGEALFGAWVAELLVGVCGLTVDPYAGDERIGRVRHLYVLVAYRRLGVGRLLVERVVEAARARFVTLRLRTANPAAARLYEALGCARCVDSGDATHALSLGDRS
jgi:GNAT superfamily N-acetyltransferase